MDIKETINKKFKERFGEEGTLFASAGRINLIGEHTDYNGGFVFPGAIDKVIMAEIRPNGIDKVRVFSIDINDYAEFGLNEENAPEQSWARYIFGVCREIIKRGGSVKGFDAVFAGIRTCKNRPVDRTQLLRRKLRHYGPVRLCVRQERPSDAPRLPLYGV